MGTVPPEHKRCPQCGQDKPARAFSRRLDRPGQLQSWCNACSLERTNCRNAEKRALLPPKPVITEKRCTRCGEMKPLEAYGLKRDAIGRRREHCRPCHNAVSQEYKQAHSERVRASNAAYREANRAELTERQRAWREAHPQRYAEIHNAWKRANPDAMDAMRYRRIARIAENGGSFTRAEWKALKAEYDHRCLMCLRQEPAVRLTVDHVIPVSLGGVNTIDNVQPLCKSCNSKKYRGIVDFRTRVLAVEESLGE